MIRFLPTSVCEMVQTGERGPGGGGLCVGFAGFPAQMLKCPRGHRAADEFRTTPTITP